jgi:lipid II:glycine glycyltransferase (peptidoglycan interpeptide bridge formation enzyme)
MYHFKVKKIAAGLYIKFKQKITYIFDTNSDLAKKTGASTCLYNYMIKEYAGQNLTFDFEGFEDGEVSSLGSFYESFDAEKKIIYVYQKNELPWPIKKLMQIRRALA